MSGRPATPQLGGSSKPPLLTLARKPGTCVNSHDILPKTGTGRKPTATGVSSRHLCALFLLRGAKPGAWPCSRPVPGSSRFSLLLPALSGHSTAGGPPGWLFKSPLGSQAQ